MDAHRDPLTGEVGAHPVGTGVGAATGGTVGAVIGSAVGGPVGAIIGATVGGLAGGFAGKGIAESVNPTEEDTFWSEAYKDRPYAKGRSYEDLRPAYRYGWESRTRHADRDWQDVENDLQEDWPPRSRSTSSDLDWNTARPAIYDAWDRVDSRYRYKTEEEPYWKEAYQSRPYGQNRRYEDLAPAYKYGWESGRTYGREGTWDQHEDKLERGWEKVKGETKLAWYEAKDAVRDAWHRATNRWSNEYASGRTHDDSRQAFSGKLGTVVPSGSTATLSIRLRELHDPETGRLDATRVANYLKIPLTQLSEALGRNYSTVHRTPSSLALQDPLCSIKRSLEILEQVFVDRSAVLAWLNSPHPDLGRRTPLGVILQGHPDAVEDMLEAAVEGMPS